MQYNNHSLTRKLLIVACLMAATSVMGQTYEFSHSVGRVYDGTMGTDIPDELKIPAGYDTYKTKKDDPRLADGVTLQRTHEYEREVWCFPGESCELLPFSDFKGNMNSRYHVQYVRWFDYVNDVTDTNLTFDNTLKQSSNDKGVFGGQILSTDGFGYRATYKSSSSTSDILGIIGADFGPTGNTFSKPSGSGTGVALKEPTLLYRHIFVIKNAKKRADEMMKDNAAYIKGHKIKLMAPAGTPFQYRLDAYEPNTFGTTTKTGYYYKDGSGTYQPIYHYLIETYKEGTLVGTTIHKNGTYSSDSSSDLKYNDRVYSYKTNNGTERVLYMVSPTVGKYTIKVYAYGNTSADGNRTNPTKDNAIKYNSQPFQLMEYDLEIVDKTQGNMITEEELKGDDTYKYQRPSEMEKLYGKPTTEVNFDKYSVGTKTAATYNSFTGGKYYPWPMSWEQSTYGFGYDRYTRAARDFDYNAYSLVNNSTVAPYNTGVLQIDESFQTLSTGEKANVGGVRYDRKYEDMRSQGLTPQQGMMLFVNGAADPGRMAELNIGKNFCTGTRVYVSAYISEFSRRKENSGKNPADYEKANVAFSFKGVKADGTETALSNFISGYITGASNTLSGYGVNVQDDTYNPNNGGKWMHIYFNFVPEVPADAEFDHFIISLENNCVQSSNGADYAIDDIRAYVCKPEVKAFQDQPICNGQSFTSLRFEADFDILTEALGVAEKTGTSTSTETFQYCFLDKGVYEKAMEGVTTTAGYKAAFDKALIKNVYTNSNTTLKPYCGELKFESNFSKMKKESDYVAGTDPVNVALTKTDGTKRTLVFPSRSELNDEKMKVNNEYIMAIMINEGVSDVAEMFDLTSTCAMTSNIKVFSSGQIKIDGELTSNEDGMTICANQLPVITVDMSGVTMGGEMVTKSQEEFDWYAGPMDAPSTGESYETYYTIEEYNGVKLETALSHFRAVYPTVSQADFSSKGPKTITNPAVSYTQNEKACIQHFLGEGVLALYQTEDAISTYISYKYDEAADTLDHKKKIYTTIIPIDPEPDNNDLIFCLEPFEIVMKISPRTPSMKDGDDHGLIPYPKNMHDVPLRIGLKQLQKCVVNNLTGTPPTGTKFLYLPLRDVTPATSGVKSLIQKSDDDYVYLAASNDPNTKTESDGTNKSGAKLITTAGPNDDVKYIGKVTDIKADATQKGNVCNIVFLKDFKFREGYWYTIKFHFEENYTGVTGDHSDVCPGDVVCTIKVVPEYQMWTGAVDGNWNNDKNWRRVSKDDLLKASAATDEYVTDGTTIVNDRDSCLVPADFTKVVIPASAPNMPVLYDLRQDENLIEVEFAGAPNSDYIRYLTPEEVPADSSTVIVGHDSSTIGEATKEIQFDMSSVDVTGGNVACRTWYDHTCDEIHFNAGAEMVGQQYLHYNKAWADVEIHPNRWYTLSTPLVNVVSGDFYLPTDGARQDTPLFEPITYDTSLNDRFKPAVFQRTWNAKKANVWHSDGKLTDGADGIELEWSHVYNETNLDYSAGNGFSVMADTSALAPAKRPKMVKFRFPKADTKYTYYNPGNVTGALNNISIPSDMLEDGDRTYKLADLTTDFTQAAGTISKSGESYFLVGNPLMCALDMKKFFAANPNLEEKYWLVTEEGQRAAVLDTTDDGYVGTIEDHPYIKPFQAFFVVLKDDATADTIHTTFTTDMMHISSPNDKTNPDQKAINPVADSPSFAKGSRAEAPTTPGILQLSAFDKAGHETKMILTNGTTRHTSGARALFDSNLADEPMIYSIINGKAMTIGECSNDTIAIGLIGNRSDVELRINGADSFGKEMMLFDALTGETQPLTTGITLSQTGNGVRYYLIGVKDNIEDTSSFMAPTVSINGNQLTITAPADNDLQNVTIHSINGVCCNSEANAGQQFTTWLAGGIYIVRLQCNGASYSYKLFIAK